MDGSSVPHSESEKRLKKQSCDRGKPPLQRAELAFLAIRLEEAYMRRVRGNSWSMVTFGAPTVISVSRA